MRLDIRVPIGLLFLTIGTLLTIFGLLSSSALYVRSLGHNVNLWWGLTLLVFGLALLYLATRRRLSN